MDEPRTALGQAPTKLLPGDHEPLQLDLDRGVADPVPVAHDPAQFDQRIEVEASSATTWQLRAGRPDVMDQT